MTIKTLQLTPELYRYLLDVGVDEHPALIKLREKTATMPEGKMQISPEQGQFMQLLVRIMQAKRILEIGTFTGYSALSMALGLPTDGKVITLDVDPKTTEIAGVFWAEANCADRIESIIGPAADTLRSFCESKSHGEFDLIFVDADKEGYADYYEYGLTLLRDNGVMLIDNVLWYGAVVDAGRSDAQTEAIRELNQHIKNDPRVLHTLLPIADGLTMVVKKSHD